MRDSARSHLGGQSTVYRCRSRRVGVLALAALVVCVATARADSATAWRPDRYAVHVFAADGLSEIDRQEIARSLADGLRAESGADASVVPPQADDQAIRRALTGAVQLIRTAERSANSGDHADAVDALVRAEKLYAIALPELIEQNGDAAPMVDVLLALAAENFHAHDAVGAASALDRALALQPTLSYVPDRFPPALEELFAAARLRADARGTATLEVSVVRGTGEVFVNGKRRGTAPATAVGIPGGPAFVLVRAAGIEPASRVAMVEGATGQVRIALPDTPSRDAKTIAAARNEIGRSEAGGAIREAGHQLDATGLALVMPTLHEGRFKLSAFLYDLGRRRLVSRALKIVPGRDYQQATAELGRLLFGGASWSAPLMHDRAGWWDRTTGSAYFWPTVAAAAVVAIAGGVYLATRGDPDAMGSVLSLSIRF